MSGSKDKRERQRQREQGTDIRSQRERQEEKERKRQKRMATAFISAFILLSVAVLVMNSGFIKRHVSAVGINGETYSVVEYNYFYNTAYQNEMSSGYASYLIDKEKPLASQACSYDETITWADYFKNTAFDNMKNTQMLYNEAKAAGMTELDEKYQGIYDNAIENLEATVKDSDAYSSVNKYLVAIYGKGMNYDVFKSLQKKACLVSQYSESIQKGFTDSYTDEELEAYYVERADDYDQYTFRSYLVNASVPDETSSEEGATTVTDESMAEAKTIADAIAEAKSEDEFISLVYDYADEDSKETLSEDSATLSENTAGSNLIGSSYAEWLRDPSRTKGDIEVIEDESGYYVMYFIERTGNETELVNVRHILISPEAISEDIDTEDEEAVAAAEEEADAVALAKTEGILDEWKNGDATEESFAALADEYTSDTGSAGGLYEEVYPGQMVSEFNAWIFDESRKTGDVEIVKTDYGYHIIYFIGHTDQTYRSFLAQQDMLKEDYEAWQTEKLENYTVTEEYFMRLAN